MSALTFSCLLSSACTLLVNAASAGTEQAVLRVLSPYGYSNGDFGSSLAMSANTLVTGVTNAQNSNGQLGYVAVFVGSDATWTLQQLLEGFGGTSFGSAVAI